MNLDGWRMADACWRAADGRLTRGWWLTRADALSDDRLTDALSRAGGRAQTRWLTCADAWGWQSDDARSWRRDDVTDRARVVHAQRVDLMRFGACGRVRFRRAWQRRVWAREIIYWRRSDARWLRWRVEARVEDIGGVSDFCERIVSGRTQWCIQISDTDKFIVVRK